MKKITPFKQPRPLSWRQKYLAAADELTQASKTIRAQKKIIKARDKTIEAHETQHVMQDKQRFKLHAMYVNEHDARITAEKRGDKYKRLATIDNLTKLLNRRGAKAALGHLVSSLNRTNKIGDRGEHYVAVVFMDLDNFGVINKNFSDEAGDMVLKTIGQSLVSHQRGDDVMVRKGGEEFVMFASCRDLKSAKAFAERLRNLVDITLPISGEMVRVTASMGVAIIHPSQIDDLKSLFNPKKDMPINRVIALANKAMRQAKAEGKNRVVTVRKSETAAARPNGSRRAPAAALRR